MGRLGRIHTTTLRLAVRATVTFGILLSPFVALAEDPPAATPLVAPGSGRALSSFDDQIKEAGEAAGFKTTSDNYLPNIIGGFIQQAIGLLGIILVVLIIYAGFLWMTAQGNEDKVKKAKAIISNAVVGMILVFAAYAITAWVLSSIKQGLSS